MKSNEFVTLVVKVLNLWEWLINKQSEIIWSFAKRWLYDKIEFAVIVAQSEQYKKALNELVDAFGNLSKHDDSESIDNVSNNNTQ